MPLPAHPHRPAIAEHLSGWAAHGDSLGALLSIASGENNPGEPPWLALCDWLAAPTALGTHALASDADHLRLEQLRAALWGKGAPEAIPLTDRLFPQGNYLPRVPQETALRAIALADCAREAMARTSDRCKPWNNPIELHPLERLLVQRHWGRLDGLTESDASLLHVLLVDDRAPKDERGRLCRLRLWKVDLKHVPGGAAWHGEVVRAPAALLLTLQSPGAAGAAPNDAFERALRKLQTVLQASLAPPSQSGEGAWAMAWSLQPVAMSHELAGGQTFTQPWGMDVVTGGSATLPFAFGALHLFRNELRADPADLFLPLREQLRAIDPRALAMSAAFAGDAPPEGLHPLDWPLEAIHGLGDKLSAFVQADRLQPPGDTRTRLALVADGQAGVFDALPREEAKTLRDAVHKAAKHAQAPLPKAVQTVLDHLLGQAALLQHAQSSDTPLNPPLSAEQLHALHTAEPASDWPPGEHRAIQWHLLQRYARWAGGEHLLWGEPAQLASDFAPIELVPDALPGSARENGEGEDPREARKTANGLYDLLHQPVGGPDAESFVQPRLWVLTAPPAAGKTTLLAEVDMHMAWRALCHFAGGAAEHFGELALWVPARSLTLKPRDKDGKPLPLREALADWVRRNHPGLGTWPDLLHAPRFQLRLLLDGVNELDCAGHERQALLGRWLDQDYPEGHRHLPPLLTVRTLEGSFVFNGARRATLKPWSAGQRDHYMQQRLRHHPEQLAAMQAAVQQDADSAQGDATRMLYSSPGMLALGCTLMAQGLLPAHTLDAAVGQTVNRARLLATYVWSVLLREWKKPHWPSYLLGPEETRRLPQLEHDLQHGRWAPPEEPGPVLAALRVQARAMQPQVQWPPADWFPSVSAKEREALLQAADHLSLVGPVDGGVDHRGRPRVEYRWRHQLLMEWFAAYGLGPDDLPPEAAAPVMDSEQTMYDTWLRARAEWQAAQAGDEDELPEELARFQLPSARVCDLEEPIKLAAQLRGNVEDWVTRLIAVGNAPLAARIALENWAAFGEPLYPQQDPLGPWRPERQKGSTAGTHQVLNALRQALHQRMYDDQVHLASRVEAGDLLGALGGSPLFDICGKALVLKDEHWMPIGHDGEPYRFEMGDLASPIRESTAEGGLLQVSLRAFHMAGYLTTNAQYRCFVHCGDFGNPAWWPGEAGVWWAEHGEEDRQSWSLGQTDEEEYGLAPVRANFWQAQAYSLWEQGQRERARRSPGLRVQLPTEAQWEGGARWPRAQQTREQCQRTEARWRFAHTAGVPWQASAAADDEEREAVYPDVKPWHFNHEMVIGWRTSPVGVFVDSRASHEGRALYDLAGNVWEWCASPYKTDRGERLLGPQVDRVASDTELRTVRGGGFRFAAPSCRAVSRIGGKPVGPDNVIGFRLVLAVEL